MKRRNFLKGAILAGAAYGFPTIVPASARGADGAIAPSNRLVGASLGIGGMGTGNMHSLMALPGVQLVSVCDVDRKHCQDGKNAVDKNYGNTDCAMYDDFRALIGRGDLDIVCISVPDHWHAATSIAAAQAGIDIYGEKPITHDLREGRALCDAVHRHGRIWQTGSWQRSVENFHQACELVINGRIGKVKYVEVGLPTGAPIGPQPEMPVPDGFDYNRWLGPAPWAPYTEKRCHWNWRWNLDYGGGQLMDWIGHHLDIAHWGLGMDYDGPTEVEGHGEFPPEGLWDAPIHYEFRCKYANGVEILIGDRVAAPASGTKWLGEKGWVHVNRGYLQTEPASLLKEVIGPGETRLTKSRNHHENFVNCVRTRQQTIAPCEIAHRSASVGHLGLLSVRLGRKIQWDPKTERILNDPDAEKMLSRAYREPWQLG